MKQQSIRQAFLVDFTKELVHSYKEIFQIQNQDPFRSFERAGKVTLNIPEHNLQPKSPLTPLRRLPNIKTPRMAIQRPIQQRIRPPRTQQRSDINIPKIGNILQDPRVHSIECQGPEQPLMINKSGTLQRTKLTLSEDEIKSIIQEFSDKSKIPLGWDIFKAKVGHLIITAIISELAGTRFIIEKFTGQATQRKQY